MSASSGASSTRRRERTRMPVANGSQSQACAVPDVSVSAIVCSRREGEFAIPTNPDFRVLIHLKRAPVDRWHEWNSHQFERRLLPGDLTCVPPGFRQAFRHPEAASAGLLYVEPDFLTHVFDNRPPAQMLDMRFRFQDPLLEQVMRAALAGGSRLFLESAAMLILERLARMPSVERRLSSTSRIRLATEYIHANLDQPISLNDLSRVSGLSPSHLLRVFK